MDLYPNCGNNLAYAWMIQVRKLEESSIFSDTPKATCSFISKLCREAGCREASDLCAEATEVVVKDEKTHLELCEQSCMLCHKRRFPGEPQMERAPYIT